MDSNEEGITPMKITRSIIRTGAWSRKNASHDRGSITVFLCILLSVLVPLIVILTDVARLKIAQAQVDEAVRLTVESVLAGYERPLRDQYGLMALAPMTQEELDATCFELLRQNLEVEAGSGFADPFGLRVVAVNVQADGGLDNPDHLHGYLSEYMRYRAPVQLSMGFVEKLKALTGSVRQARCIETEMELDRLRAIAREDLVRIHLLKAHRLDLFGKTVDGENLLRESQNEITRLAEGIGNASGAYDALRESLQNLLPQYMEKQRRMALARSEVDRAKQALEQAKSVLSAAQSAWDAESADKEEPPREETLPGKESSTEEAASSAGEEPPGVAEQKVQEASAVVLLREASLESAEASFEQAASSWKAWHETQWIPVEKAAQESLDAIAEHTAMVVLIRQELTSHLYRQSGYLEKSVFLANGLLGQLTAIEAQAAQAMGLSQADGDAVSTGTLEASVAKKPDFPTAGIMDAAKNALSGFHAHVQGWLAEAAGKEREAQVLLQEVERCLSAFLAIKSAAGGGAQIPALPDALRTQVLPGVSMIGLSGMKNELEQSVVAAGANAAFTLSQSPSAQECEAFQEWFTAWSGETERLFENTESPRNDGLSPAKTLQSLREVAGNTAAAVREGQTANQGGVIPPDQMASLPSMASEASKESVTGSHPYAPVGNEPQRMHEREPNEFTLGLGRVTGTVAGLEQIMAQSSEALFRNLWADAYLLSAFTHAVTPDDGIPNEIVTGRSLDNNVYRKGEVEYILFGQQKEQSNLIAMKGALFAVRLALNLVHVHASAPKRAATLALATTLAGWTVFGIPVVQNFLMVAWAAAESFSDLDRLLKGESIPLVKTDATWFLSVGSLRTELVRNLLLDPLKGRVAGAAGSLVGNADAAVRDTVGGWLDAAVDGVFAPLETACADYGTQITEPAAYGSPSLPTAIISEIASFVAQLSEQNMQKILEGGFVDELQEWSHALRTVCAEMIAGYGSEGVVQVREGVKAELRSQIFDSPFYRNLVEQARTTSMGLTDTIFNKVSAGVDERLGSGLAGSGLQTGITGRMATMNYQEYLAVFLLLVPQSLKTLRAADLIQLNLQNALEDNSYRLQRRYTRICLETTVEMDFWFLPESLGSEKADNQIHAQWEMGY